MGDASPRRGQAVPRCPRCALHRPLCLCAEVEPLALSTRVIVVQHAKEASRTSNSGRLVPIAIDGGEVRLRGARGVAFDASGLDDPGAVLLYPQPGAERLTAGRATTLVVPDGNWAQARKLVQREPALRRLPTVALPPGSPSRYRLRTHPDPERVSTFEAVARAIGVLDGAAAQRALERVFTLFVERTLYSRGTLPADAVAGGVTAAMVRGLSRGGE